MKKMKYVEMDNVRNEEMRQKWQRIMEDGVDPFDPKHVEKYVEGRILMQTAHWYVFKNDHSYPSTKHHFVIVSNSFYCTDQEMSDHEWIELKHVKEKLCKKYHIHSGGFIFRFGNMKVSGASVQHFHVQVLVPKNGETVAAWFGSEK